MLINTHILLANSILSKANGKKIYLINRNRFLWGNVKPDCVSKYKFKKHYYEESIDMVIKKIDFLSNMSIEDLYYDYGKSKFSEELGVVCHFLCDFFCVPHNQRWEFKKAIKKHVLYEKRLSKAAKSFKPTFYYEEDLEIKDIKKFIAYHKAKYETVVSYYNDLDYAYFMCNSIMNAILNQVSKNQYLQVRRAS